MNNKDSTTLQFQSPTHLQHKIMMLSYQSEIAQKIVL